MTGITFYGWVVIVTNDAGGEFIAHYNETGPLHRAFFSVKREALEFKRDLRSHVKGRLRVARGYVTIAEQA